MRETGLSCPDTENLKSMALLFHCQISEILNGARLDTVHSSMLQSENTSLRQPHSGYERDISVTYDFSSTDSISPFLFGDNLEHTRDCVNSGISAQMLKNRKFVGKPDRFGCASCWYRIGQRAYFSFGDPYTRHAEGYRMQRMLECNSQVITNYHSELCGIGQKELYLTAERVYDFRLVAKAFTPTEVTVCLKDSGGQILADAQVTVEPGKFAPIELSLCPDGSDDNACLELTFTTPGTIWLGAISLMPHDNFRGMRPDVIDAMKQIGMKVLRWPGGNFAGEYNWKDGLLPCDQRAPFQSYLWLETQPHTLGYDFHEINIDDFIALCREIGAQPFITLNPTWNTPLSRTKSSSY